MTEKFRIDPARILSEYNYTPYDIHYWVYDRSVVPPAKDILRVILAEVKAKNPKVIATNNHSCFADFRNMYANFVKTHNEIPNRILYNVQHKKHSKITLDETEIDRWVNLCKEYKLMPKNIGPLFLRKKHFILNLENINVQQMYLYLCSARYIQEEPYFIRTFFYFLDEGIDFYIAFTLSSNLTIGNSGHAVLPVYKGYSSNSKTTDEINKRKFNLNYARKLRIFTQEKIKKATHTLLERKGEQQEALGKAKASGGSYYNISIINFAFHDHLEPCAKENSVLSSVSVEELKEKKIVDEVYSNDGISK